MRIATYIRVSTQEQAVEGYSIEAQKERLSNYCKAKGWQLVTEYIDATDILGLKQNPTKRASL